MIFAKENEILPIICLRQERAKNTVVGLAAGGNVMEAPWTPQVIHLRIDQLFQVLSGLKVGNLLGGDKNFFSRFRVAALSRCPFSKTETPETPELNFSAILERLDDTVQDGLYDRLGILLAEI